MKGDARRKSDAESPTTARHPDALQPSAIVAMAAMAAIATAITTITPFTAISIPPNPSSLTFPLPRGRRLMFVPNDGCGQSDLVVLDIGEVVRISRTAPGQLRASVTSSLLSIPNFLFFRHIVPRSLLRYSSLSLLRHLPHTLLLPHPPRSCPQFIIGFCFAL